jgi:chromosome segregation ATPase
LQLLREVISEKENVVAELKIELEDQSREIYDLKMGTGVKDLEEAKRDVLEQFFEKNREVDELGAKVKKLERRIEEADQEREDLEARLEERKDITQHPDFLRKLRELERLQADLVEAAEASERLGKKLEEFGPETKSKLEAQINFLERKNDALQEKLEDAQSSLVHSRTQAQAAATASGTEAAEVESLREELGKARTQIETMEKELEEAEELAASAAVGGDSEGLDEQLGAARAELAALRAELAEARASAPPAAAGGGGDNAKALEQLEEVTDAFAGFKQNITLLKTYADEAGETAAAGGDIAEAIESLHNVLNVLLADAGDLRQELKGLESLLTD